MASWNRTALIVEDQPFAGMVASDILRENGFETFHANDASGALAMLQSHPEIEVLVTEADLAGPVDGLELSRRCPPTVPISARRHSGDRDLAATDVPSEQGYSRSRTPAPSSAPVVRRPARGRLGPTAPTGILGKRWSGEGIRTSTQLGRLALP